MKHIKTINKLTSKIAYANQDVRNVQTHANQLAKLLAQLLT